MQLKAVLFEIIYGCVEYVYPCCVLTHAAPECAEGSANGGKASRCCMQPLARMQFVAMVGAAAPSTILKVSQVGTDWGSKTNCGFAIWDGPFSNLCKKILLAFGQGGDWLLGSILSWSSVILQVEKEKLSCISPCQQRGMDVHHGRAGL